MGLRFSSVTAGSDGTASHGLLHGATVGSSILLTVLTKLSLGDAAQYGALVQLSPLAFAGWLGLFITALNLLPVGQLDGGLYNTRNVRKSRPTSIAGVDLTDRKEVHGFVMWAMIGAQMLIEGVRGGDPGCCELSRILCSQMPQFTCPKPPGNGSLDSPAARLAGPHPESLRSEPG